MKGAIERAPASCRRRPRSLDPAAVRQPGQRRGPQAHHRPEILADFPGGSTSSSPASAPAATSPASPSAQAALAPAQGLRGRAHLSPVLSGGAARRRTPFRASAPAFIPGGWAGPSRRRDPGRPQGRRRVRRSRGPRGGDLHGGLVRGLARGGRPEAARDQGRRARLTFTYDTGERYLSVPGLFDADGQAVRAATNGGGRAGAPAA